MRNLKRVLSLTLASIMLLGMMVIGTSAASDYSDVDYDNDNVEAIEVLQAINVMSGDLDGNGNLAGTFRPGDEVSRAEMARIMAALMDLDYEYYISTNPFTDMVGHWAEGYAAACYANGIIYGRTDTTYDPNATVTTVEAAAMLMRALGYFQNIAVDYADGFEIATIRQGGRIELFNGVDAKTNEPLTRNDVAQLVLNTLKSSMVEIDDSSKVSVTVGDAQVSLGGSGYTFVIATGTNIEYARSIKQDEGDSIYGSTGPIVELGEKLYQGDLKLFRNTSDAFGRPAVRWTYKTEEIGTYVDYPTVYKSWTAKVAKNELYSFLGSGNANELISNPGKLSVYVDGELQTGIDVTQYLDRNNTGAIGDYAGKGVLTEVFQDNDNFVTITFINTYLMQATADYNTSSESVRVTVLTSPDNKPIGENVLEAEDFDGLADLGIVEDDYILYTYAKGAVQSVQKAEVVTGEVTAYSVSVENNGSPKAFGKAGGSVSIDGNKRDYAKYAETDTANGCGVEYKIGATASIVLDAYDYVLYVDDSSLSVGNYVYIYAIAPQSGLASTFIADAFFTDGTREEITVKELKSRETDGKLTGNLATTGNIKTRLGANADNPGEEKIAGYDVVGWYAYSRNSSGQYSLEKAATSTVFDANYDKDGDGNDDTLQVANNRISIGGQVSGDKNTIFVVYQGNNKISVYTGIANVPDITGAVAENSGYLRAKDSGGKNAIAVFIDASNGASVRNGNSDLLYLLKEDSHEKNQANASGDTVYTWNVILVKDGAAQLTTVQTTENWNSYKKNAFKSYGVDSDGYYELNSDDLLVDGDNGGDDVSKPVSPAAEISCDGETFSWGVYEYIVNSESVRNTALVVYPDKDTTAGKLLADKVQLDEDADYKPYTQISGRQIANEFRGYAATGYIFAVTDDDLIKSLIVVVDGITESTGITPDETGLPSEPYIGKGVEIYAQDLYSGISANGIKALFDDNNTDILIVTNNDGSTIPATSITVPAGKTLVILGGYSGSVQLNSNATLAVDEKLTITGSFTMTDNTTVHVTEMQINSGSAKDFRGTVKVDGELGLGDGSSQHATVNVIKGAEVTVGSLEEKDTVSTGNCTINVYGTLTVGDKDYDASKVEEDTNEVIDGDIAINVYSTSSLNVYGLVGEDVEITTGDDDKASNNGRVTIVGKMLGTYTDQNVGTDAPMNKITSLDGAAKVTLGANAKLETEVFKPTKIDLKAGAEITLLGGLENSNLTVRDTSNNKLEETDDPITIKIAADTTSASNVIADVVEDTESENLFSLAVTIVYNEDTFNGAVNEGYIPVLLGNETDGYSVPKDWEDWLENDEAAIHGITTTFPWLLAQVTANEDVKTKQVSLIVSVYKGDAEEPIWSETEEVNWDTDGDWDSINKLKEGKSLTMHWDMATDRHDSGGEKDSNVLDQKFANVAGSYTVKLCWSINDSAPIDKGVEDTAELREDAEIGKVDDIAFDDSEGTTIDGEMTASGEVSGKVSTTEDGKLVLNKAEVSDSLELTEGNISGSVTVGRGAELTIGAIDAGKDGLAVTVEAGADVTVDMDAEGVQITFVGKQTKAVVIDADDNENITWADVRDEIAEMFPEGGQIDITGVRESGDGYDTSWGMVSLVIPRDYRKGDIIIALYNEDDHDTPIALSWIRPEGENTVPSVVQITCKIGGAWDWVNGTTVKKNDTLSGTYYYAVYSSGEDLQDIEELGEGEGKTSPEELLEKADKGVIFSGYFDTTELNASENSDN